MLFRIHDELPHKREISRTTRNCSRNYSRIPKIRKWAKLPKKNFLKNRDFRDFQDFQNFKDFKDFKDFVVMLPGFGGSKKPRFQKNRAAEKSPWPPPPRGHSRTRAFGRTSLRTRRSGAAPEVKYCPELFFRSLPNFGNSSILITALRRHLGYFTLMR